ncbi:MAG: hypothetical protein R3A43_02090 [Bacteroidia bacterium]
MKSKLLNFLLIITPLIGYLEWGGGNSTYIFQAEYEVISKLLADTLAALHPLTILPLVGQIILLFTLFQQTPSKRLTYSGIACLGILLGFMFFIGLLGLNFKIVLSTLPFLVVAVVAVGYYRKLDSVKHS